MNAEESYNALAEHLGYTGSERFRTILENMLTPDQARIVAALPGTAQDVAQNTGFDPDDVQKELDQLFFDGILVPKGDFKHREFFRFAWTMGQLHDRTQATKARDVEKDRKFYELWHDFVINEWYPDRGKNFVSSTKPFQRIVPAYKSIKDLPNVLPYENFHELLKAQETIAVVPCSCRTRTTSVDEHCEHTSEEERWNCLQFGRSADYVKHRDSGTQLMIDEALELCDKIEDEGLLHMWANNTNMLGITTSCQCCRDCCMDYVPMDIIEESIGNVWEKSRFEAYVDQDKCIGCQDCVDRCMFDAIEMIKPDISKTGKKSKKMKAVVDPEKCWGCGVCVVGCDKVNALAMKVVRPPEHISAPPPRT